MAVIQNLFPFRHLRIEEACAPYVAVCAEALEHDVVGQMRAECVARPNPQLAAAALQGETAILLLCMTLDHLDAKAAALRGRSGKLDQFTLRFETSNLLLTTDMVWQGKIAHLTRMRFHLDKWDGHWLDQPPGTWRKLHTVLSDISRLRECPFLLAA